MMSPTNQSLENLTQGEIWVYYADRTPDIKRKGDEWRGPCPIHKGKDDNFAVEPSSGVWYCHSQCGRGGSLAQLEMELTGADFNTAVSAVCEIIGRPRADAAGKQKIIATYDYKDRQGNLLHQTVRFEPKEFRQRRPDGNGGWIWNLKDVEPVLYRLDELASGDTILVAEGEKDVDALVKLGFTATCNPMGAGKWREHYTDSLAGKDVVIFPDNDEPGASHVAQVARSLLGKTKSVRIAFTKEGKDVDRKS